MTAQNNLLASVLEEACPRWRAWLRARYPSLAGQHPEFIQDAATDLTRYSQGEGAGEFSHADLSRIGFAILKRRVADHFRAAATRWAMRPTDPAQMRASQGDPVAALRYEEVLRLTLRYIMRLPAHDRNLLMRRGDSEARRVPMTVAERQRLSRLRTHLREDLAQKHGIDIKDFLREEE